MGELAHLRNLNILETISLFVYSLTIHINRRRLDIYSSYGRPRKVYRSHPHMEIS